MTLGVLGLAALVLSSTPQVQLIVSGRSGGVSANYIRMAVTERLTRTDDPRAFSVKRVGFAALERHGCYLLDVEHAGDPRALRKMVRDPSRARIVLGEQQAVVSQQDLSVDDVAGAIGAALLGAQDPRSGEEPLGSVPVTVTEWRTKHGRLVGLETPACRPEDRDERDPLGWEVRSLTVLERVTDGKHEHVFSVSRPLGEGARRHRAQLALRKKAEEAGLGVRELLAGDDIEGASYLLRTTSLHRPLTVQALKMRRPAVWVPQADELQEGVAAFLELAEEVGAAPVSANLRSTPSLKPYTVMDVGERKIVVIGVTSPGAMQQVPAAVARKVKVEAPAPAVQKALRAAVEELGEWPDAVIVLGVLEGADALAVADVPGVDLAYVRFERSAHSTSLSVTANAHDARAFRRPLLAPSLSPWRVETSQITFHDDGGPSAITHQAAAITVDLEPDPHWRRAVQRIRQPIYEDGAETIMADVAPLLSGKRADKALRAIAERDATNTPRWSVGLYNQLTSGVLQDATWADVAITPAPRDFWRTSGGFNLLRLQAALQGQDEVVMALLPAAELTRVVTQAGAAGLGVAGMKGNQVGGRGVDPRERYLVVTTDALAVQLGIENHVVATRFLLVRGHLMPAPLGGRPVLYRALVLGALKDLKSEHTDAGQFDDDYVDELADLLHPRETVLRPRVILEARDLTSSITFYDVEGADRYPAVPDNRVRTPQNVAVLLTGMARAGVETKYIAVEGRVTGRWDRRVFGTNVVEAANTWVATLEFREPILSFNIPRLKLRTEPYTAVSFESQFPDPMKITTWPWPPPKLAFGRVAAGAAFFGQMILRELRLGMVAQQDFTQRLYKTDGIWRAPGLSVGLETSGSLAYEIGPLGLELTEAWRWLAPRPGVDTARDLALTGLTRAAVKARLFGGLSASLFADSYVFLGKQPHDVPGISFTIGVGLAVDRTWKPLTEGFYLW